MVAITAALVLLASAAPQQVHQHEARGNTAAGDTVPLYDDLGTHHYGVTVKAPLAQQYFDQGLRLYYAFNHAEAIRSFRAAQRADPSCAMCWWGEALAWGPNINMPMDSEAEAAAHAAARRAAELSGGATDRERALIEALGTRYGPEAGAERAQRDSAYARAMAEVAARYPDDAEAAVLHAEALMTLRPWQYWKPDATPQPGIGDALAQLERVMEVNHNHPGACHFFIHAVEEKYPERAVACAERLASLMPGAGHLVHMPGHIYVRVGRYMDAVRANEHAVHADETYIRDQRPAAGMYTMGYYPHNYDFMAFAAAMAGREEQAVGAAERVAALIPPDLLGVTGMAFLQHYMMRPMQLRVRFGRWDAILAEPAPAVELLHARALWHYGRGRALLARGDLAAARDELAAVERLLAEPGLADIHLEFNAAADVLRIAQGVLAGRIAAAEGNVEAAVRSLHAAAAVEDGLVYGEPPEWTVPVRHELGEVLLAAGRAAEAEAAYEQDLRRFPENGWALEGLAIALLAQGRAAEATAVATRLGTAWKEADGARRSAAVRVRDRR
jgi:tetratricopeptide (TPR) repeat protein